MRRERRWEHAAAATVSLWRGVHSTRQRTWAPLPPASLPPTAHCHPLVLFSFLRCIPLRRLVLLAVSLGSGERSGTRLLLVFPGDKPPFRPFRQPPVCFARLIKVWRSPARFLVAEPLRPVCRSVFCVLFRFLLFCRLAVFTLTFIQEQSSARRESPSRDTETMPDTMPRRGNRSQKG